MIETWNQYKDWLSNTITNNQSYIFRGQENPNWKLQTTFHRISEKTKIDLSAYMKNIIPKVAYEISSNFNEYYDLTNDVNMSSFLAKLQHHGFPTPLLDWTYSPYIAAYFALKDIDIRNNSIDYVNIYIFDFISWSNQYEQLLNLENTGKFFSLLQPHALNNQRVPKQMSIATVTNVNDIQNYLENTQNKNPELPFLQYARLPVKEKPLIMNDLALMGINELTLFPGLDGLCKSMKIRYFG